MPSEYILPIFRHKVVYVDLAVRVFLHYRVQIEKEVRTPHLSSHHRLETLNIGEKQHSSATFRETFISIASLLSSLDPHMIATAPHNAFSSQLLLLPRCL